VRQVPGSPANAGFLVVNPPPPPHVSTQQNPRISGTNPRGWREIAAVFERRLCCDTSSRVHAFHVSVVHGDAPYRKMGFPFCPVHFIPHKVKQDEAPGGVTCGCDLDNGQTRGRVKYDMALAY
jgi:hypothetical protein